MEFISHTGPTICGDAKISMAQVKPKSVRTIVTSPPYWGQRDYGMAGQIGREETPEEYLENLVDIFRASRETLTDDGTLWINIADSYAAREKNRTEEQACRKSGLVGSKGTQVSCSTQQNKIVSGLKAKDLVGIPWRLAMALRDDGWYLRQSIIWNKPNTMPESVKDRCSKSHEYIFMLSKSPTYFYNADAIKPPIKQSSVERMARARGGKNARYVNGAPGQPAHDILQPKPNQRHVNIIGGNKHKNMEEKGQQIQQIQSIHRTRNSNGQEWDNVTGKVNMRDVWNFDDPMCVWEWLFLNYPDELINPMWEKYFLDAGYSGDVWTITTKPFKDAHFAAFPPELPINCIKASTEPGDTVMDMFSGAGTTKMVSYKLNRKAITIELNPAYIEIEHRRMRGEFGLFYNL